MRNLKTQSTARLTPELTHPSLRGHFQIARVDHWFKNVFVLPGVIAALGLDSAQMTSDLLLRILVGLSATCLIASSNYVINEIADGPFDRLHPSKSERPVPSGLVNIPLAYAQWLLLMVAGLGLGLTISISFTLTLLIFWIMGCIYNLPPVRSKDIPYADVLSEAVNGPLRLLAGWAIVGTEHVAPLSLLLSYWMIGCYFMGMKRFAEYRHIGDPPRAAAYRRSFGFYTEERLLISIMFYGSAAMLFFGAFIMRYRLELVISFPLVALMMAIYLALGLKENSTVQQPEGLYREPVLMVAVIVCVVLMGLLFFIDIPMFHQFFSPTAPTVGEVNLSF